MRVDDAIVILLKITEIVLWVQIHKKTKICQNRQRHISTIFALKMQTLQLQ
jgi:hypothetical protein